MPDNLYQAWFNATFSMKMDNLVLHASPTYFLQKSQVDEEVGALDIYQYGLNAGVGAFGFDLTAFYAKTGDDTIYDPWGYGKVIVQQILTSGGAPSGDRSDEDAYAVTLVYEFAALGVKGLSAYVFYGIYDAPGSTINETDSSLQYAFSGNLDGLRVRLHFAQIDKDNGQEDFNDYRLYVTYRFGVSGK